MKKRKKIIISIIVSILIVILGLFGYYKFFYDENKLNLTEKEWINSHKSSVITFNIPSDLNIFASSGKGVFYDFLSELEKEYEISLNKNVVSIGEENGLGFVVSEDIDDDDLLIYQDHLVIVAKEMQDFKNITDLNGKTVGGLSSDISRITSNYQTTATYNTLENKEALTEALKDDTSSYIIVSLNEYIDEILANDFQIVYHLDDLANNYYINLGDDKTLNSIITKYYNSWIKNNYEDEYYSNTYDLFIEKLGISQIETDDLTNKTYVYGFVNNTPFQTLESSRYGGKIISYLEEFSKFSNIDFTYTKFKTTSELSKSFEKGKVDLIFNNTSYEFTTAKIETNIKDKYYIISPLDNNLKLSSLNDLKNVEVYVIKNSKIASVLEKYQNIELKYVKNEKELLKMTHKNKIIALSSETYNYLINNKIKNYHISYEGYNSNYSFVYQNNDDTFYKLFSSYINYLSEYQMTNQGLISYQNAEANGNLISTIAKYILLAIALTALIIGVIISSKKKIKLNTKIRKDEKLKFIDMLTSLKNRNYLNDRISIWNQNTIYPQAIIVIDLNNIKYLNDTFGHTEGDKQIMAAANILHQTQLDNSEIMRTDGNEFMIYLVGYPEKQVINYLKKLVKEFKELPYEYGAAFGFSMIVDDLKLVEDAINEATLQMRENKGLEYEKAEEEN
jgi:diguanylate cyclase (GGDEF)-like protein